MAEHHDIRVLGGGRDHYLPGELPTHFPDDMAVTDYSDESYVQVRNGASGLAALYDQHRLNEATIEANRQWQEFSPPYRQKRIQDAKVKAAEPILANVKAIEKIAESAEKEASELDAELSKPEQVNPARAAIIVSTFTALPAERRTLMAHRLCQILADDSGATSAERQAAREYLLAITGVNQFAGLVSETERAFVQRVLSASRNPAKASRARHLHLASRHLKETATRMRSLMAGGDDRFHARRGFAA